MERRLFIKKLAALVAATQLPFDLSAKAKDYTVEIESGKDVIQLDVKDIQLNVTQEPSQFYRTQDNPFEEIEVEGLKGWDMSTSLQSESKEAEQLIRFFDHGAQLIIRFKNKVKRYEGNAYLTSIETDKKETIIAFIGSGQLTGW